MSQHIVIIECPEKHLRHIDGVRWMVTATDVSAKYFSAGGVSQILVLSSSAPQLMGRDKPASRDDVRSVEG